MRFRELLQYELWSKKTSRKILIGLGIVIVVFVVWAAIEQYWISPGERKVAKIALLKIDDLQDFATISGQDFDVRARTAGEQIASAQRTAWTMRDRLLALSLSAYFELTKIDQEDLQRRKQIEQRFPPHTLKDAEFADQNVEVGEKARLAVRFELHAVLD
jgi:hypothetical protein